MIVESVPSTRRRRPIRFALLLGALTLAAAWIDIRLEASSASADGWDGERAGLRVAESSLRRSCDALSVLELPPSASELPAAAAERARWKALCLAEGLGSRAPFKSKAEDAQAAGLREWRVFSDQMARAEKQLRNRFPVYYAPQGDTVALAPFRGAALRGASQGLRSALGRREVLVALSAWQQAALAAGDADGALEAQKIAERQFAQALAQAETEYDRDLASLQLAPFHAAHRRWVGDVWGFAWRWESGGERYDARAGAESRRAFLPELLRSDRLKTQRPATLFFASPAEWESLDRSDAIAPFHLQFDSERATREAAARAALTHSQTPKAPHEP